MNVKEICRQGLRIPKQTLRSLDARLKPYYCLVQQAHNHGVFAVDITAQVGFFAQLNWCLYIFAYCERYNLRPYIVLSSPYYTAPDKGKNWLDYFFINRLLTNDDKDKIAAGKIAISHIREFEQLGLPRSYVTQMTLKYANYLLNKYLHIKPYILEYVDRFIKNNFMQEIVAGLHYRGTDKVSEAPAVPFEIIKLTLDNYLKSHPDVGAVYVASDETSFIEKIRNELGSVRIIVHDDQIQSTDGKAIHTQAAKGDNYVKGKEAIINCLLLSRCDILIKNASFMSAWSCVLNPELQVIMLNKPYVDKLWFPDREIIRRSEVS